MPNFVVARHADGRVVKGTSMDVDPSRPVCHVRTPEGVTVDVRLADLKALFFVKDLSGNAKYTDATRPDPADARLRGARTIRVTFEDGETIVGITHHFPPTRAYYFVLPLDAASNNIRVLINASRVKGVQPGP
ncbi:MAG: hypothetical protein HZB25_08115 [Candidatus Eisenbacteria bacterium]|nr:hypothetical protein [Candidatus Eisenbacteria bacterium]